MFTVVVIYKDPGPPQVLHRAVRGQVRRCKSAADEADARLARLDRDFAAALPALTDALQGLHEEPFAGILQGS